MWTWAEGRSIGRGEEQAGERAREGMNSCMLDWSIPAFGGGAPYMHVNSCCILHWGCYLIPNECAKTDVALQIVFCMLPEECAQTDRQALTTVQLSPLNYRRPFETWLEKEACRMKENRMIVSKDLVDLTFNLIVPLSAIENNDQTSPTYSPKHFLWMEIDCKHCELKK